MPNDDEKNQPGEHAFEEDTEEAFTLPKPTPEVTADDDAGYGKKADSSIDDLEIEVDEDELEAESESESPGRKY